MRLAAFALVTAALAAGCGGVDKAGVKTSEQPVELVLADHDGSPDNSRAWAEAVSRRSGGTLRIRVEAGWGPAADYEKALLGDVRGGKVALAMVNARALDEVGVTSFQPLVAPMLIDSAELERRVLGGDVSRHALAGLDKLGLVGLAVLPTELRRPLGITRVMGSPRAYRRAMVYTREGKVARDALTALGAAPVHKGADVWAESVDAAEVSLGPVEGQGEAARYYSGITANVVLWPQPAAVVMRRDAFDRLSPAQQSALRQAAGDVLDQASRRASDADTSALKNLCRIGAKFVDASPGQIQAMRTALEPVYEAIERGPGNAAAIARIRALKGSAVPESLTCSAGSRPGAGSDAVLDGTYTASISRKEAETSSLRDDINEFTGQNWGEFTLRLSGGTPPLQPAQLVLLHRHDRDVLDRRRRDPDLYRPGSPRHVHAALDALPREAELQA